MFHVPDVFDSSCSAAWRVVVSSMWRWNVPTQGVYGLACDLPSSICSNDERIND
jgi:hypothetical protein